MDKTQEAAHTIGLRHQLAMAAMQAFVSGHISHYGHDNHWPFDQIASASYDMADAMLKATGTTEHPSAPAPSLALTAFIQDVEAAEEDAPAQCEECAGSGRVEKHAKVDNSGYTDLISICCDACEGTGKATGSAA